jgi:hypothetical protein
MSDSLPENSFSGALRVLKLTSGEEIIALVTDASADKINIKFPALLETYMMRDENNQLAEYVKLTNYLSNIKGYEINLSRAVVVYMGHAATELEKMYEVYFMAMQNDPKTIVSSLPETNFNPDNGLQLLNDLFNNEDFVNFVNDMIDSFEGVDILEDTSEDDDEETVAESFMSPPTEEVPDSPPKKRKRKAMKPETNKLPYNPESPPDTPESWSDNPEDYI